MKDFLKFKEFISSVHFHTEVEIFYGKIEEIDDLISFEGKSVSELKKSFYEAVEDYIDICKKSKKELFKSFKGSFNVRISPELHKKIYRASIIQGISLNHGPSCNRKRVSIKIVLIKL